MWTGILKCSIELQKFFRSDPSVNRSPLRYAICTLPFNLKRLFTKTMFRCIFCSDKSVQTWFGPFQKPIRYGTFHFQQRSGAVLFRSRNSFESSIPIENRSPIRTLSATLRFSGFSLVGGLGIPMSPMSPLITAVPPPIKSKNCPPHLCWSWHNLFRYFSIFAWQRLIWPA